MLQLVEHLEVFFFFLGLQLCGFVDWESRVSLLSKKIKVLTAESTDSTFETYASNSVSFELVEWSRPWRWPKG